MNDPLTREIWDKLSRLSSEAQVSSLVDSCMSVSSPTVSENISALVQAVSMVIHPSNSLYLLKFISAYSKKDAKFFNRISSVIPEIVVFCFQSSTVEVQETILLYVSGWKMRVSPWPQVAEQTENALSILRHRADLSRAMSSLPAPAEFLDLLHSVCREGDKVGIDNLLKLKDHASGRLDVVIAAINQIRSTLET